VPFFITLRSIFPNSVSPTTDVSKRAVFFRRHFYEYKLISFQMHPFLQKSHFHKTSCIIDRNSLFFISFQSPHLSHEFPKKRKFTFYAHKYETIWKMRDKFLNTCRSLVELNRFEIFCWQISLIFKMFGCPLTRE
jgi:hypothetical protein